MIEPRELRIGNYVFWNSWQKVTGLHEDCIVTEEYLINNDTKTKVIGIPLTEEILLKCDKKHKDFMVDKLGFVIFKNGYAYQFVREDYRYIHQIQNLYHSIKQKELNIELKKKMLE